jgi:bacteriocin-like protein
MKELTKKELAIVKGGMTKADIINEIAKADIINEIAKADIINEICMNKAQIVDGIA